MTSVTFTAAELVELTRYTRAAKQLVVLHTRGFHRAYIDHTCHVVLERAHYEAVCRGEVQLARPRVKPPAVKASITKQQPRA